jgi:hypothetical protein
MPLHPQAVCHSASCAVRAGSPTAKSGHSATSGVSQARVPRSTSAASISVVIGLVIEPDQEQRFRRDQGGHTALPHAEDALVDHVAAVHHGNGGARHVEAGARIVEEGVEPCAVEGARGCGRRGRRRARRRSWGLGARWWNGRRRRGGRHVHPPHRGAGNGSPSPDRARSPVPRRRAEALVHAARSTCKRGSLAPAYWM